MGAEGMCGSPDSCLDHAGCDCGIPGNKAREADTFAMPHEPHDREGDEFLCPNNESCPSPQECAINTENCVQEVPHMPLLW